MGRFCMIWAGFAWSVMVLLIGAGFFVIWTGSVWSKQGLRDLECVLCDPSEFCVIRDSSTWPERVLRDLSGFCVCIDDSAWSVMVLCDQSGFCVIQVSSGWSVLILCYLSLIYVIMMVLCDLSSICIIWACSMWTEPDLRDRWWFHVIWAGSVWSILILCGLSRFCLTYVISVWSVMVLHDLWFFCVICMCDGSTDIHYINLDTKLAIKRVQKYCDKRLHTCPPIRRQKNYCTYGHFLV